ncbi:MAG: penicillin-binding protein 1A [Polaribacter sp.]|jgi:penicillin-binding protein 1A
MKRITKLAPKFAYIVTLFTILFGMGFTGLYLAVGPDLPEVESIRQIKLQTPMSIYSKDGQLINEFGDIRRIPITMDEVPQDFINALLSTEDVRFYHHSGVDLKGVLRAIFKLAATGTKSQGASTITMLVARNYFLSREKRFSRKFTEMFVAWKLESELTKDEILEIFLNKIPFGHRSAGLGAAAEVYYGKQLKELSLAQLATLAGIPKGQSVFNPISYPEKARTRRTHVLGRMLSQGHINNEQYTKANNSPIKTNRHGARTTVSAPYVAEMVHLEIIKQYGLESAHSDGLKIYTSLDPKLQNYAQKALKNSLMEYDRRHGYRPIEQHYEITSDITPLEIQTWIADFARLGNLIPAIAIEIEDEFAKVMLADGTIGHVNYIDSKWARKYVDENHREYGKIKSMQDIVKLGDVIRVLETEKVLEKLGIDLSVIELTDKAAVEIYSLDDAVLLTEVAPSIDKPEYSTDEASSSTQETEPLPTKIYQLSQIPDVSGGFVVLNPKNGAIEALAGGFDFSKDQFNMVTQARRQVGSNIKPFLYSAALAKNFSAASLINDSPIIESDISAGNFWRPENDNGKYKGPTTLRSALRRSVNTVAIRLINKIGPHYAKKYIESIGFPGANMKAYPSLALGSASFTPLEVVTGYAALANGGFKVTPWFIQRIEDSQGEVLFQAEPITVCEYCLKLLEENAQKDSLLAEIQSEISDELQTNLEVAQLHTEPTEGTLIEDSLSENSELLVAEHRFAERVIDERNLYILNSMLKDVIHKGTGWTALNRIKSPLLKRYDLAGKTGTTNENKDAWFTGYNSRYVASAWVGFVDHSKKLGKSEFGGRAALPVWAKFMEKALDGMAENHPPRPDGLIDVRIDLENGKLASASTKSSGFEIFRVENMPTEYSEKHDEDPFDYFGPSAEEDEEEIEF